MKIIVLSFITIISIVLSISFVKAGGGYTGPEFIPINGQMCRYNDPIENTVTKYTQADCLELSDPATFQKFRKGKLLFGKDGSNLYIDKNALYFHPMNGEWERREMDTKNIHKIAGHKYFEAGDVLYYYGLPHGNIKKVRNMLSTTTSFLAYDTIIIKDDLTQQSILYYKGIPEKDIDAETLEKDTINYFKKYKENIVYGDYGFLVLGNSLFIPDSFVLHRIDSVNTPTLRKTKFGYQDKNNFYRFVYGHYGFDIVIKPKNR